MPYFEVVVVKTNVYTEQYRGRAFIKAEDEDQAKRKLRAIDRHMDHDDLDVLIDFGEEEDCLLINTKELAENAEQEFTTTVKKLRELGEKEDRTDFTLHLRQEIEGNPGSDDVILKVPNYDRD